MTSKKKLKRKIKRLLTENDQLWVQIDKQIDLRLEAEQKAAGVVVHEPINLRPAITYVKKTESTAHKDCLNCTEPQSACRCSCCKSTAHTPPTIKAQGGEWVEAGQTTDESAALYPCCVHCKGEAGMHLYLGKDQHETPCPECG